MYSDGSKGTFGSDFKYTRYAIVLLAGISMSNFEEYTKKIENTTFISYYRLYKVAKFFGLDFERTKTAPSIYKELTQKGKIRTITMENNRTFITFTEEGKKNCVEKLDELQDLYEYFGSKPPEREKRKKKENGKGIPVKGGRVIFDQLGDVESEIDSLIKKISHW